MRKELFRLKTNVLFLPLSSRKKYSPISDFAIYNYFAGKWKMTKVLKSVYQNLLFCSICERIVLHYKYITMTFCLIVHGYIVKIAGKRVFNTLIRIFSD